MISQPAPHHVHRAPLRRFEQLVERIMGADTRLLYGMAVPVVGVAVLIALALGYAASPWMVGGLMVLEALVLCVVLVGFVGVLNDDENE